MHYALACIYGSQCGYATVVLWFSVHVGAKTSCSECVYDSCTVYFNMHVGLKISVHECGYALCFSMHVWKSIPRECGYATVVTMV